MLPALFVSHGAPSLPFDDVPARDFLRGLGREMGKPRAILIASAHGAWVPLMLMFPDADIPVVQLSVQSEKGAAHHIALGRGIAKLRDDNVLVMGSGGFVHNLGRIAPPGAPEPGWSREFSDWMHDRLMSGDEAALADYRRLAPHAVLAQPSEDHFMPLFVALGAGGEKAKAARLHSSATFGSLRMDAYSFS